MELQLVSIILEGAIALLLVGAARKNKPYLYGLALTFIVYVYYDLARLFSWEASEVILQGLFLVATISALIAAFGLYKEE